MTERKTIVVTGAGGYVGPHVVTAALDRGHDVLAVLRPGAHAPIDPRARTIHADILADDFDAGVFGALPSAIVHLAWKDGFAHNSLAHMEQLSAHFRFLTNLSAKGIRRIVALGTMHEVGYWEGAITSTTPTNPLSQYGIAKDALRRALPLAIGEQSRLAWLRCYYIYGDDRRNRSIFARILESVDEGKTEFPFTTGKNRYDFIRVEELGRQIAAVTDADDIVGIVNCSSGVPVSLADKVEEFIAENHLPIALKYGAFPDRPYDSPGVWGDATVIADLMERERRPQ
jgi:nucleoside-diphosphate-sugar epimerase